MTKPLVDTKAWQCSACSKVFLTSWQKTCPNCGRVDYWCGSVDPKDIAAARAEQRREKKPHGLKGRKGGHGGRYTPAELEETRQQMLSKPYEQVKAEFMKSVAESKEKPVRRPSAGRKPVTLELVERAYRKALGELEQ